MLILLYSNNQINKKITLIRLMNYICTHVFLSSIDLYVQIYAYMYINICILLIHLPSRRQNVFYAWSKERPNVEGVSNALGLPTRDQLHRVFLQVSLNEVVKDKDIMLIPFARSDRCARYILMVKRALDFNLSHEKSSRAIAFSYFTYAGFVILVAEVFFLLFRHFFTYASIK